MPKPRVKVVSPELSSAALPRNFTISTGESVRAITIGVPSYAARRRRIEDALETYVDLLLEHDEKLAAKGASAEERRVALHLEAQKLDLTHVNRLIEAHNRYYPIEANLPVDPRTGDYMIRRGTPFEPEPPITSVRLLADLAVRREHDQREEGDEPERED